MISDEISSVWIVFDSKKLNFRQFFNCNGDNIRKLIPSLPPSSSPPSSLPLAGDKVSRMS